MPTISPARTVSETSANSPCRLEPLHLAAARRRSGSAVGARSGKTYSMVRPVIRLTRSRVGVVAGGQVGRGGAAVLEHGDPVADLADLLEPVRDVDDGDALRGQLADDPEQVGHLVVGEHRARLVHDDQPGLVRQRPGHADDLLAGGGQRPHQPARRDLAVAEPGQDLAGCAAAIAPRRTKPKRSRLVARGRRSRRPTGRRRGRAPGRWWRCRPSSRPAGWRTRPARPATRPARRPGGARRRAP